MDKTHIFLDESGFTGQDLLNPHQPVFCVASTILDDASASRYHAELLEGSNAREVKHNRLMRRPSGQAKIANLLRQIKEHEPDTFAVSLWHKRFALLTYFVDLWCEPLALESKFDLYEDGAALAMTNMTYFCLPSYTSDEFLASILRDFQMMMIRRTKQSYGRLRSNLTIKYNSSNPDVRDVLLPLFGSIVLLGYQNLCGMIENAIDPALPALVRLCHIWRGRTPGPFVLYHDRASQLARDLHIWDVLLSKDMAPAAFATGQGEAIFPVNVERVLFVDSFSDKQIQLCDVVAGAVGTFYRALVRDETSDYIELLREVDLEPLVTAAVWPVLEVDPDKLGMRGWSGAMVDYVTDELVRLRR